MKEKVFDFKKEYKDLYMPKVVPMLIDVPPMNFMMVDGSGDPNDNKEFDEAVELLYGLSYTIKMSKMKGNAPKGYFEYIVAPLEGLWGIEGGQFSLSERENWIWTVMIRQPDFVDNTVFQLAKEALQKKNPGLPMQKARFEFFHEGLCVQAMHLGPYATEPETMKKLEDFMGANALEDRLLKGGRHHEIYLSDPRKSKPDTMKTVLRHPVEKI